MMMAMEERSMKLWVKSDWNGFFGLFTNNLTNILTMAVLLSFVVGLPDAFVYGKILPGVGLAICVASLYYAYMAYKLAKKTGRSDVTALPSGSSVPHMFLIVFSVIGPVYWTTGDATLAWSAGLIWAAVEGIIEVLGVGIGMQVRKWLPRSAMLGALAGVSITYIALNPAFSVFYVPYIGLLSLAVVVLGFIGKVKMPFNLPVGLVAILFGMVIGWVSGYMSLDALTDSFSKIGIYLPQFSLPQVFNQEGLQAIAPVIIAAIPLGIYNFIETIDNVESAAAAGDDYNTREALAADGITTLLGVVFGSPFPTAVFIGHPGWKESGARIGYAAATGLGVLVMTCFGIVPLLLNIVPLPALYPILLYIGVVITTQAFTSSDLKYAPAAVIAMIPWLAEWTQHAMDTALGAAGTDAGTVGNQVLTDAGINYLGAANLGAGAIVVGMILGSIVAFIIDRKFLRASITSLVAVVLTFFGVIHSPTSVSILPNAGMTIGYALVALLLLGYHFGLFDKLSKKGGATNHA
jgi:AGZA family xanthine/uracil permease-like MFS transporter